MLELFEISVVVLARNHNPTILNPDFLISNKIVSRDWELSEPPVCAYPVAQVKFKNKINIVAQLDKLIFSQNITGKTLEEVQINRIARTYVENLPHVDYRAVGINPKGFVKVQSREEAEKFVSDKLIVSGPWKTFKNMPSNVITQFKYLLADGSLSIKIENGLSTLPDQEEFPVIFFGANFHHETVGETTKEKTDHVTKVINFWQKDIDDFLSFVNESFLEKKI